MGKERETDDRQTDRQREKETEIGCLCERWVKIETDRQTDRKTDSERDKYWVFVCLMGKERERDVCQQILVEKSPK